jgi:hypothetical protein
MVPLSRNVTDSLGRKAAMIQKTTVAKVMRTKVNAPGEIHSGTMIFAIGELKPKIKLTANTAKCPGHLEGVALIRLFLSVSIKKNKSSPDDLFPLP